MTSLITESPYLLPGQIALVRNGTVVWVGELSAPWEDVIFDTFVVSTQDYNQIVLRTLPDGRKVP